MTNEARVHFRDIKPYAVPKSLADLRGPRNGLVELRHSVLWAPGSRHIDLEEPGGVGLAYRAVISEGTVADQIAVLNKERLIEVWSVLLLPRRAKDLWEERFPELCQGAA
ncbi:transcriptional regulator [Arachnia propionica]|uniref:Transcriptional regulator n=1 Tax=Arachnia propionica TaxID=1750 RepID=A0A3P1TBQ4_9ACTN|nr:transcriptional regulator [Arachnia propionica]RRD06306.1 transcriptional regulator [Arachnia propionica]